MSASSKKKLRKELNAAQMTEKQKKEKAEARNLKIYTAVFLSVIILVAAIFLVSQVVNWWNRNGISQKNTIALTIGDHELNSVELNYYFYDALDSEYNNLYNNYGYGTSTDSYYYYYRGLDLTKSLDSQYYDEANGLTWADYYLQLAMRNATSDYILCDLAKTDTDFTVPADVQTSLSTASLNLQFNAAFGGYTSVDQFLAAKYGNGATQESYLAYYERSLTAAAYYNAKVDELQAASEKDTEAIRAWDTEHYFEYSTFTYASYTVKCKDYLTGGTPGENNTITYSEEERKAAEEAAKAAALGLGEAANVEELDNLIALLPENKGSTTAVSTKNTDKAYSTLNEDFIEWLTDDARAEFDKRVFPITSSDEEGAAIEGYTILMFQSRNDRLDYMSNIRYLLFAFEEGTEDADGNIIYSDEEKARIRAKADETLAKLQEKGFTEEGFIAVVSEYTGEDTETSDAGSLWENYHEDSSTDEGVYNWLQIEDHQPGDAEVIQVESGYLLVMYVSTDELTYRDYLIATDITGDRLDTWYDEILEGVAVATKNLKYIQTDLVYSSN